MGGGDGVKHNFKMMLFSAKIVWTSSLNSSKKANHQKIIANE